MKKFMIMSLFILLFVVLVWSAAAYNSEKPTPREEPVPMTEPIPETTESATPGSKPISENPEPVSVEAEAQPTEQEENPKVDPVEPEEPSDASSVVYDPEICFYSEPLSDEIKQKITGVSYHENDNITYDDLRFLSVLYVDFNGETQQGELICNKAIADDLLEIFRALYDASYQIDKIRLIDEYGGDDDLSCDDNNSSCFNYRVVGGTDTLSKHALGLAVDINPFQNPYITYPDGVERISPKGSEPYADRDSGLPHMILEGDLCYNLFIEHGFTWGGHWKTLKDYQHFQKTLD